MKPKIMKIVGGRRWECLIPEDQSPTGDEATEQDWYDYLSCGIGDSPIKAYEDWLRDCNPKEVLE
jgi:hypothetical protein